MNDEQREPRGRKKVTCTVEKENEKNITLLVMQLDKSYSSFFLLCQMIVYNVMERTISP